MVINSNLEKDKDIMIAKLQHALTFANLEIESLEERIKVMKDEFDSRFKAMKDEHDSLFKAMKDKDKQCEDLKQLFEATKAKKRLGIKKLFRKRNKYCCL